MPTDHRKGSGVDHKKSFEPVRTLRFMMIRATRRQRSQNLLKVHMQTELTTCCQNIFMIP